MISCIFCINEYFFVKNVFFCFLRRTFFEYITLLMFGKGIERQRVLMVTCMVYSVSFE